MQRTLQTLLVCLLPLFASGCMTHKLWTESALDEWNEPAPNPNLRLFNDERRHDVLVVYDEYSERRCATRPRAYYLEANQASFARRAQPHFVNFRVAQNLSPVPVFATMPPVLPESLYAVATTNSTVFTVFFNEYEMGSQELPVYNDRVGQAERVALTPVAVTVDATIAGGVLGYFWLQGFAADGNSFSWRP